MIKVILKNGVVVEVDDPLEASKVIHLVYLREFTAEKTHPTTELKEYNGVCKNCGKLIPAGSHKWKWCGSEVCRKKIKADYARRYYNRPEMKAKRLAYYQGWIREKRETMQQPIITGTQTGEQL